MVVFSVVASVNLPYITTYKYPKNHMFTCVSNVRTFCASTGLHPGHPCASVQGGRTVARDQVVHGLLPFPLLHHSKGH